MKKVLVEKPFDPVLVVLDSVDEWTPIFAKENGKLAGMIVQEKEGWILRLGGGAGSTGYHKSLRECLQYGEKYGYEFFIED